MDSPRSSVDPPAEFEEYRLLRPLGRGGMGEVHLARDLLLDRLVAIKFIAGLDPDNSRRARFFVEARAVARLQHPNVAAIHRVGLVRGRPYLVTEYVQGRSLDRLPWPVQWETVLSIALGLSRGLAAAHRRGILHRDVKPENAILSDEGEPKLLDFGLAQFIDEAIDESETGEDGTNEADQSNGASEPKDNREDPRSVESARARETITKVAHSVASRAGHAVTGTPLYMAPEIWDGSPASRRSDIYSMGVMLYELCAGQAPYAGFSIPYLRMKVGRTPIPPLGTVAPSVDLRFASLIDRCLEVDPARRFESGDVLREALERLLPQPRASLALSQTPYPGLRAFEADQRDVFFGRDADVRALVERLRSDPFVLVAGDSGVGKSSLCRAGVIPLASEGALSPGTQWTIVRLVPGRAPVTALAAALATACHLKESALADVIAREPESLLHRLRPHHDVHGRILVFVDQLEELVTLAVHHQAAQFSEALGALVLDGGPVKVLATVRSDFLSRVASLPGLGETAVRALHLLLPLSQHGLREAIVGPAATRGVRFEPETVVDALVDSAGAPEGGTPLLQFTLSELWEARDATRSTITEEALARIGGVTGSLARHADAVLASLLPAQRIAARRILLRLVTPEGTRARRDEHELLESADPKAVPSDARAALEALVRGRLLVAREMDQTGESAFELAHEALINGWKTLRDWLDDGAEQRAVRHRLQGAAAEWERLAHADEALWNARQIAESTLLDPDELLPVEARFLARSRQLARRRRWRRAGLIAALPLTAILVYGGIQGFNRWKLSQMIDARLRTADSVLARARAENARVEALRASAFALYDAGDAAGADPTWQSALGLASEVERGFGDAAQSLEGALALDSGRVELRRRFAGILYERALLAERDHHKDELDDLLRRLVAWDDGGEWRRRWEAPARVRVETRPAGARVTLQRFEEKSGRRVLAEARDLGMTPLSPLDLTPGSYLFILSMPDRPPVRYPIVLTRGEDIHFDVKLPRAWPPGFVYVPPGRFLFGSGDDERVRDILGAVPIHATNQGAYFIGRTETTYGDWLEFLEALPASEREIRRPHAKGSFGAIDLAQRKNGTWEFLLQPRQEVYRAVEGQRIHYLDRSTRADVDWVRLPVAGISWNDAQAYVEWLRRSGRLPGARLCNEFEWERAARGADDRVFPSGDHLAPDDANHDETYGRKSRAFGPDEVGSHPASDSSFGVSDLAGNVWEWTRGVLKGQEIVYRGGSYYQDVLSARSDNRSFGEPTLRTPLTGLRLCADPPSD